MQGLDLHHHYTDIAVELVMMNEEITEYENEISRLIPKGYQSCELAMRLSTSRDPGLLLFLDNSFIACPN